VTSEQIIASAIEARTERDLRLEWFLPSEGRNFTAYPKNEAQKQVWLVRAEADGWELV
jgi:hypothetical protein